MSTVPAESDVVLGSESAGLLMSPEEFDAIEDYDENYQYELVNGVLVVHPISLPEETGPNEYLAHVLLEYRERHLQGKALDYTLPQRPLIKGDARCHAIAAASILAKVHRDACRRVWDLSFPAYGLASHKGYATPEHRDAIERLGITPLHRRSFQSAAYLQLALEG